MKKSPLFFFFLLLLLGSCDTDMPTPKNNLADSTEAKEIAEESTELVVPTKKSVVRNKANDPTTVMLGKWTGEIAGKPLTIVIETVKDGQLVGYKILGNRKRPLKGSYFTDDWNLPCSVAYEASLQEPGDNVLDGSLSLQFVGHEDTDNSGETAELICLGNLKGIEGAGYWTVNNNDETTLFFKLMKEY